MNRIVWATLLTTLFFYGQSLALEITSVAPSKGTPGTVVTVGGGPFSTTTQPFLGEEYVSPRQVFENQLEFTVPFLPPGSYKLTVQDDRDIAAQSYNFEILAPIPRIIDIDPPNLDFCSNQTQRTLYIEGESFLPGSVLLVDGKVVPSRRVDLNNLEGQLPLMQPGVYGVAARNPDGETSLPHSLWVNSIPEITNVEQGDDSVYSYEIIIRGKNFFFNSALIIQDSEETIFSVSPRARLPKSDRLVYVDCNTLIYTRHPSIHTDNQFSMQIINPDGQKSGHYSVSLP